MLPLENTDKDSSHTSLLAAHVVKLRSKPVNTLSWNATDMTLLHDHAISSSIVLFTFLQITLVHLALIIAKVSS